MKTIKDGIVFSDDIERILNGNNALNFNYSKEGFVIPNSGFIKNIRESFSNDVRRIFDGKVTILSEDEMVNGIDFAVSDIMGKYPHRIFG